jgi:predicted metalloprotease
MKTRLRLLLTFLAVTIIGLTILTFPAKAGKANASLEPPPDLPLNQLLPIASGHINGFWLQSFYAKRLRYTTPTMVYYSQPIKTPCGIAVMNNAFYCAASNSIYYDYNFMSKMYSQVGDYAAVSILAHEWGHLVQTQLGIGNGRTFSIQMELQADCFSGAYTQYAEKMGVLEEGDMEEAGVGLFSAGDPKGMPWFAPLAHGKSMQRISAFLDGYKRGAQVCFR